MQEAGSDIAVIGMSGRFPGARNLAEFWSNIANGVESISRLTDAELAAGGVPEAIRRSPDYVPVSSRLENIDAFDAEFFGYSPREAALLDPQGRICLELAWHALEDAGYDPGAYGGPVGVFATASLNTYLLQNLNGRLDNQDFVLGLGNIPVVLGNGPDFIATRVSYKLNLRGPSQTVQTACSSSLMAVHLARQSLLNGECDMALAGGVSIYLPQDRGYQWRDGMILSSDGHCRAFDADADGVLFGRGGGIVVLKTVAQALEDGDRIRAIIKGSAANNDGSRKVGFAAPSVVGQSRVITEAMGDAGVRADSVSYIEAHGTGTSLGDPIEIAGLTEAYRKHTKRTGYCAIGTVKTNIGHLDVAAGVTALIKTVLMLEHRQLAPSLNYTKPNPAIDFASSPFVVNTTLRPWEGINGVRRAGVSAFGIGGTNVHLIVDEANVPLVAPLGMPRSTHIMRLSARTDEALSQLASDVATRLAQPDAPSIDDATFTANTGRAEHAHRLVVRGNSADDMRDALGILARGEDDVRAVRGVASSDAPPVAFLFTGLGAQSVGMGAMLFKTEPVFRAALEKCDALLRPYMAKPLLSVIYPAPGETSPIDESTYGQPVTFAFEYALAELWKSWGLTPAACLGHSLGEYASATISGLLRVEDGLRLVATRARLADSLPSGRGMAAAFASEAVVRRAIGPDADSVFIGSINSPENMVMSGTIDALNRVAARLVEQKIEVRMLNVFQAFHSPMLDPILDEYEAAVAKTQFGRLEIPVISNVTGQLLTDEQGRTPKYWRTHAREVVRYAEGVKTLYDRGIRHFLELGPHTTAMAMAAGCIADDSATFVASLRRGRDDFDQMFESLSTLYARGVQFDWKGIHAGRPGKRVAFPLYPFARERHWIDAPAQSAVAEFASTTAAVSATHPLIGEAVESPLLDVPAYALRVDVSAHRYLDDHRVFDVAVLPATAYLEAAREAIDAADSAHVAVLEDIVIAEPMLLGARGADDARVDAARAPLAQIVLRPEDGAFAFEVFSRSTAADDDAPQRRRGNPAWTRHASGRASATDSARSLGALISVATIRSRCATEIEGDAYYAGLAVQGFGYGPSFQGLTRLWVGDGEVLGEVQIAPTLDGRTSGYGFHPAHLDACLQAVFALAPLGRSFVPLRIDRVELGPPRSSLFVHAVRRPGSESASAFVVDLRIADERGEVVAAFEGIELREASARRWGARSAWEQWLYEPTWRALPLSSATPMATGRRVLVASDDSRAAGSLAERLRASGTECVVTSLASVADEAPRVLADAGRVDAVVLLVADGNAESLDSTRAALSLVQALVAETDPTPRLWIATHGARAVLGGERVRGLFDAPLWGLANVVALEHAELRCACVDLDTFDRRTVDALVAEIAADGVETRLAYRGGTRFVERIARANGGDVSTVDTSTMRVLESATPGTLDGLRYVNTVRRAPVAGEVEILVRAAGLNFKDVLTALGQYPDAAATLGNECAGHVIAVGEGVAEFRVGDAVLGFAPRSLASHTMTDARLVARLPDALTFEQGATIAGGFLTAQRALRDLAQLRAGETVLVHAATGGVGLAAVQLARRVGARVIATAGSDAKRTLLREMGVEQVFNSRTPDFGAEILRVTNGRGVDVVLNSLTGRMLEASVDVLAARGRFVELGMTGEVSPRMRERVEAGAAYFNPNVAQDALRDPALYSVMLREIVDAVARGELAPLPLETFDASDVTSAFRLMARAGHVGKLVVRDNANVATPSRALSADAPAIVADATYLVVGGLGGLGLLVANWLVERGARNIAILSRGEPSVAARAAIDALSAGGAKFELLRGDVSRRADVDAALARVAVTMPPLRGVIQSAGLLDDGALEQQRWNRFAQVMAPKVAGTWHLHTALGDAPLEFFIVFSSAAALLGSKGQGNHAAANAFLDAFAAHRRACGLAALSINWGAWADAGAAAGAAGGIAGRIAARGWGEIAPADGIAALDALLAWPHPQIGVIPIDWATYAKQFNEGRVPPAMAELARASRAESLASFSGRAASPAPENIADRVRGASAGERIGIVEQYLREQVAKVLGIPPNRRLDSDAPLVGLGLDSLLAVELRNALSRGLALTRRLPATLLFDYPTIATLTDHLLGLMVDDAPTPPPIEPLMLVAAASDTDASLARDIMDLTDEEAEALLLQELE